MSTSAPPARTPRVTRRRGETRRRMLDAAFAVFAEQGLGRTTIEQVCDRAGYTRGAFYSNFASLDDLFLAMWAERSEQLRTDLAAMLAADLPDDVRDVRDAVERALSLVPLDDAWYRVTAEFAAHALRTPSLRRVVAAREEAIVGALVPLLVALLARAGREVTDPDALGHALVAVHDGTWLPCLLEPDDPEPRRRRTDLFLLVVEHHTREAQP